LARLFNGYTVPRFRYRILYEIKEPDVVVLAVIHKRRDLQPEMVER